ncbi:MAG: type II toxin-antitoxin system RelE/ParE family toxin [Chitinophagales bacterium]
MPVKVVLLPSAREDYVSAKQWYEEQRKGLGYQFKQSVVSKIEELADRPHQYPVVLKSIRKISVKRFPYLIYFFIDKERSRIIIYGILHGKRNPAIIKRRSTST